MAQDYYVPARSEESIAQLAYRLRDAHIDRRELRFNIIEFIDRTLPRQLSLLKKGELKIELYNMDFKYDDPAFVSFNPRTLNSDRKIWADASLGEAYPKFVMAHEIGHLTLHDHLAKAFSQDKKTKISFADKEHSAEWQANTFAGHFLLPDSILEQQSNAAFLASVCQVPDQLASERVADFLKEQSRKTRKFHGSFCFNCGNCSQVPEGTLLRCTTIGCGTVVSQFRK
jgi:Zn-dependent peptidase ImmA (M78 family)